MSTTLRAPCLSLARAARLVTSSHQAAFSRAAVLASDIQVKDKLKEAKRLEVRPISVCFSGMERCMVACYR